MPTTPNDRPKTIQEEIFEKSKNKIASTFAERSAELVKAGQAPEKVLQTLLESINPSQQEVERLALQPGAPEKVGQSSRVGLIPALINTITGEGQKNPFALDRPPIGMEEARARLNFQRQGVKDSVSIAKDLVDLAQSTPESQLDLERKKQAIGSESQVLTQARKDFNEAIVGTKKGLNAIDKVRQAASELGDFEVGTLTQVAEIIGASAATFAKDPKFVKFEGIVNQTINTFARDIFGEKGPLANEDIARTLKGIGANTTIPLQTKLELLDSVQESMAVVFNTRKKIAEITDEVLSKKFPKLMEDVKGSSVKTITMETAEKLGVDTVNEKTNQAFDKEGNLIGRII